MALQVGHIPVKATITRPVRAFNEVYTNDNGRPMLIIVSVLYETGPIGSQAYVNVELDGVLQDTIGIITSTSANEAYSWDIFLAVPRGSTYELIDTALLGGTVTLGEWTEIIL